MGPQEISIRTLGDLVAHGYGMNALCERCRHRVDLDMAALIERFGAQFVYVGKSWIPACGARAAARGAQAFKFTTHSIRGSRTMARSSARDVRPSLSDDPRDEMLAALNWACTKGS
jgi:hypothetical protein